MLSKKRKSNKRKDNGNGNGNGKGTTMDNTPQFSTTEPNTVPMTSSGRSAVFDSANEISLTIWFLLATVVE